eukprot:XP_004916521.1 PREDICTED: acrosin-binding protein-like [Xenopus tropicalis]
MVNHIVFKAQTSVGMARGNTFRCFLQAIFMLFIILLLSITTCAFSTPLPGSPLNEQEYEKFFSLLISESSAETLCTLRYLHGCGDRTIRRFDAYENHGVTPAGPICTNLESFSHFDSFCDFAKFRCAHRLFFAKRIPCEDDKVTTTQASDATPKQEVISVTSSLPTETPKITENGSSEKEERKLHSAEQKPMKAMYKSDESVKVNAPHLAKPKEKPLLSKLQAYLEAHPTTRKKPVKEQNEEEVLKIPYASQESSEEEDDDIRSFAGPKADISKAENNNQHKPVANKQKQKGSRAIPKKKELVLSKAQAYEMAQPTTGKKPVKEQNKEEVLKKPYASQESSEEEDDDIRSFVGPKADVSKLRQENNQHKAVANKQKQKGSRAIPKMNKLVLSKLQAYEMAKPTAINKSITEQNKEEVLNKPYASQESSEEEDNDIRSFVGLKSYVPPAT